MQNVYHSNERFCPQQLIVPITIICLVTKLMNNQNSPRESLALPMNLNQFNPPNFVLYRLEGPHVTLEDVKKLQLKWLSKGIFLKSDDVAKSEYDLDVVSELSARCVLLSC